MNSLIGSTAIPKHAFLLVMSGVRDWVLGWIELDIVYRQYIVESLSCRDMLLIILSSAVIAMFSPLA